MKPKLEITRYRDSIMGFCETSWHFRYVTGPG